MLQRWSPIQVLSCVRSAFADGVVPGTDFPALLAVLHQHMPADDVAQVATELVVRGLNPHTALDHRAALAQALPCDVERVISQLRAAGSALLSY